MKLKKRILILSEFFEDKDSFFENITVTKLVIVLFDIL